MSKKMIAVLSVAALAGSASAQLYSNGGLADLQTGATTASGVAAPAGGQWSEVGDNGTDTKDNVAGSNHVQGTFRVADNFTVPAGQTWNITQIKFWTYATGAAAASITNITVALWNTDPTLGGTPVQGDQITNVLGSNTLTNTYRIFNTRTPLGTCAGTAPGTTRRIQEVTANVNFTGLTAGTYWVDWAMTSSVLSGPWAPSRNVKPLGTGYTFPGANALQANSGLWAAALGNLQQGFPGTTCVITPTNTNPFEYPFELFGTSGGGCRPDLTTTAAPGSPGYGVPNGQLNSEDFFYFLAQYAANNLAVCDLTNTAAPGSPGYGVPNGILNSEDFFYYLAIYAAGCNP